MHDGLGYATRGRSADWPWVQWDGVGWGGWGGKGCMPYLAHDGSTFHPGGPWTSSGHWLRRRRGLCPLGPTSSVAMVVLWRSPCTSHGDQPRQPEAVGGVPNAIYACSTRSANNDAVSSTV